MTKPILCAVDFSEASDAACEAAVELGRRLDALVILAHVLERLPLEAVSGADFGAFAIGLADRAASIEGAMRDALTVRLEAKANELSKRGPPVETRLLDGGSPWDSLIDAATREQAQLIVMGTHGRRGPARWLLGSVAERTVRGSSCPVIVVPGPHPGIREWGERRNLRVAVALDLRDTAPIPFVRELRGAGPCDVTAVHLFWPPAEIKRTGTSVPYDLESPPEEIRTRVEAELRKAIGTLPGKGTLSLIVRPEWGRLSDPLFEIAKSSAADLLVVGTHSRHVLDGFTSGSTAFGVLKRIELPVVFVPHLQAENQLRSTSTTTVAERELAVTDW